MLDQRRFTRLSTAAALVLFAFVMLIALPSPVQAQSRESNYAVYANCNANPCTIGVAAWNWRKPAGWRKLSQDFRGDLTAWRAACAYHRQSRYNSPDLRRGRPNCQEVNRLLARGTVFSSGVGPQRAVRRGNRRGSGGSATGGNAVRRSFCPYNAKEYRGTGRTINCGCAASETITGTVWGSGPYTDDSRICVAARHAGVIDGRGGNVTFRMVGPRNSYARSSRNGVSTGNYGKWHGSFRFTGGTRRGGGSVTPRGGGNRSRRAFCPYDARSYRGSGRTVSCGCAASETTTGTVWGSGPYTDDSRICKAARHSGIIGRNGGNVTFRMVGPRNGYAGSSRNGVTSTRYGKWRGSYVFTR